MRQQIEDLAERQDSAEYLGISRTETEVNFHRLLRVEEVQDIERTEFLKFLRCHEEIPKYGCNACRSRSNPARTRVLIVPRGWARHCAISV